MPTKKGKSKPAKAKKASNKRRRSPKRGVEGRPAAARRLSTGRVTAVGTSARKVTPEAPVAGAGTGAGSAAGAGAAGGAERNPTPRAPEGAPNRKATGEGSIKGTGEVRIL